MSDGSGTRETVLMGSMVKQQQETNKVLKEVRGDIQGLKEEMKGVKKELLKWS